MGFVGGRIFDQFRLQVCCILEYPLWCGELPARRISSRRVYLILTTNIQWTDQYEWRPVELGLYGAGNLGEHSMQWLGPNWRVCQTVWPELVGILDISKCV